MLSTVYKELAERLNNEIKTLKFIDLYNHQLENSEVPDTPAVLIEFRNVKWNSHPKGVQLGDAEIVFHIIQEIYEESFVGSHNMEGAMKNLEFLDEVHNALQGFSKKDVFASLDRTDSAYDADYDAENVHTITYSSTFLDASADKLKKWKTVTPVLVVEKKEE